MGKNKSELIVVTGATGQLGGLIVQELIKIHPAKRIIATTRTPEKADHLRALGVHVRWADFSQPETLPEAFKGADQLLVVSSNARASGEDPVAQHHSVFSAAKDAGTSRIVFTSQMAASQTSAFPPMRDFAASETLLANCGVPWVALRHGFYGTSGIQIMMEAFLTGKLTTAQDGRVSWVAHSDLAEAAALILTGEAQLEGPTPPLTGPQALDLSELAALASEIRQKPITHEVIGDDQLRTSIVSRGIPEHLAEMILGLYIGARDGEWRTVDPTLQQLLGRPLVTMREQLAKTTSEEQESNKSLVRMS